MEPTRRAAVRALTIAIVVERRRVWHERVQTSLQAAGHRVGLVETREGRALGPAFLLACERVIYGTRSSLFATATGPVDPPLATPVDVAIVLAGRNPASDGARRSIAVCFDGETGETAMLDALLAGGTPMLHVTQERSGDAPIVLSEALPAIEDRTVLARALDHLLARLIVVLVQAVERVGLDQAPADRTGVERTPATGPVRRRARGGAGALAAAAFLTRNLAGKVGRRLARGGPDHWHVSWRLHDGPGVAQTLDWPETAYATLPDDGTAYYADPFPFEHDGTRHIFCEQFPYATGKGIIAVFEIGADGCASAPRPVLDHAAHLSYPQIFARDGTIYMLPEMGAAGRIELFRAAPFPDRWVSHAVLIDGLVAGDATLVDFEGRLWLFAAIAGDGGSSWDQLSLFHAPALEGPWHPHAGNPVLIDARCARPAGSMWVSDGVLWRVAQDCREGYGAGLSLCRVDTLDPAHYAQTLVKRLGPPGGLYAEGVHTLNRSARMETIDWRAPRGRILS